MSSKTGATRGYEQARPLIGAIAVVVAVVSFTFVGYRLLFGPRASQSTPHEPMVYFYDLNTGDIFSAAADERGPVETESGSFDGHPAGVRAHVYACQSCDDPSRRFVGWLEIPIEELAAWKSDKYGPLLQRDDSQGEVATTMVKLPGDEAWVTADSAEAIEIFESLTGRCGPDEKFYRCRPPSRPLQ